MINKVAHVKVKRKRIEPFFRWYDLWIGAYIDTKNKMIYICPLPMVGIKVFYGKS